MTLIIKNASQINVGQNRKNASQNRWLKIAHDRKNASQKPTLYIDHHIDNDITCKCIVERDEKTMACDGPTRPDKAEHGADDEAVKYGEAWLVKEGQPVLVSGKSI